METALAHDNRGRIVLATLEACTTIGTVTSERVDLVYPSGHRDRIFTFVPWGGEIRVGGITAKEPYNPSATWLSPTTLRISVGTVDSVVDQRSEVGDVKISYDLGAILYK